MDSPIYYAVSVTDADLLMTDGHSLERVGVEPDIAVLPNDRDLASKRDPAMSKAAGLVGGQLSPEEAGTVLSYEESDLFQRTLSLND